MPNFWQFPTVSMGLGPLMAIYQARFMKYLEDRGIQPEQGRKVWAFMGDGEMDEPESLGAISLAARENLDNLIFVINCNLQRLDGPVRGNGKIIQELEAVFRGAGWNVLKVVWGSYWDHLLAKDKSGMLRKLMEETVDGEYQNCKAKGGAYTREHFFGKYPETRELVADMSDEDIWRLNRGGHDPHKVYAAYADAVESVDRPTVILAKTVKGYGMGEAGEGQNITHSQKKMGEDALKAFRDRFNIPISDDDISEAPFYKFPEDSEEMKYMRNSREKLGGYMPVRSDNAEPLVVPGLEVFDALLKDSGEREISTTMAFVRMLSSLARDKNIGKNIVPIVPDEARTFGMEGMFRQLGIYSFKGQLYEPMDSDQVMYYREDVKGQILEEGINEAGAMSSWIAAGSAYSAHGVSMIPFYIYYSMFGFQRIGDLAWAAGDMQVRGFLMGGTAGRTTLAGEGLQHQDGHSLIVAGTIPNCVSYDPTFAYELAVIIHDGLKRMYQMKENVFYYISVMNENYHHPALPKGSEEGIIKGIYCLEEGEEKGPKVQLMGSGTILREVIKAAALLKDDFAINSDVWSVTSVNELARDGKACARWNQLHPTKKARQGYLETQMLGRKGPVIISTDYIRAYSEQIREFIPTRFVSLGTDGFGRSDTRDNLRIFFEVNRYYIVVAALKALSDDGEIDSKVVQQAIKKYGIDPEKPNPVTV
jgi:pyruvate dehydrogenase E1 component